jgi:hypothetical protein
MPLPSDETTPPVMKMNLVMGVEEAVEGRGPYPPTSYQNPRNGSMQLAPGSRSQRCDAAPGADPGRTTPTAAALFTKSRELGSVLRDLQSTKHFLSALPALVGIGRRRSGRDRCLRLKMSRYRGASTMRQSAKLMGAAAIAGAAGSP